LANIERDVRVEDALIELGWNVIVVWECELASPDTLRERLLEEIAHGGEPAA